MSELDNPAGRLHELFVDFGLRRDESILSAWSYALGVGPQEVVRHLGDVIDLVADTRRAAESTGQASFRRIPEHLDAFLPAIWPTDKTFATAQASTVQPDPIAMADVEMLSAYLSQHDPEPELPSAEQVEELRQQVSDLIDAVKNSTLPPDVKRPLLHRLADVLAAIEHMRVRGPEAARLAAEALGASAVIYDEPDDEQPEANTAIFQRVRSVAKAVWFVFTAEQAIQRGVLGWDHLYHMVDHLISPPHAPRQLPPGDDTP